MTAQDTSEGTDFALCNLPKSWYFAGWDLSRKKKREIQFDLRVKRAPAKHGIDCNYAVSIVFPTGLQMNHFPLIADASLQCVIF